MNLSQKNSLRPLSKAALTRAPGFIVASLIIANFLAQMMQTMLNTALPRMMRDLSIEETLGQWLVTVYFLVAGIIVPVAGFLIGRFSTRALFFASGGAFIAGTLLAAVAPGFSWLLAGRFIQGVGAGLLMPLFQTTILRVFPKERIGAAMGLVGLVMGLAPAMGPALSGFIVEHHSWRLLFYGILPISLANLVFGYLSLQNVGEKSEGRLDRRSVLYSSVGFSALIYGLSLAGKAEGGISFWVLLAVGVMLVTAFVRRQVRLADPLLDMKLFRNPAFTQSTLIGILLFFIFIGVELMLPLYAQNVLGLTPRTSGLMLIPGALLLGVSGLIAGRLYDRFGVARITRLAFMGMMLTLVTLAAVLSLHTPLVLLLVLFALFTVSVGLIMSPITAYAMSTIPGTLIKHASPMTIAIRSFSASASGAVLTAIMVTVANGSRLSIPGNKLLGLQVVFWILAGAAALGLLLAYRLPESARQGVRYLKERVKG